MNRKIFKNNKSGFKNISQRENGSWRVIYQKYEINKKYLQNNFYASLANHKPSNMNDKTIK
jgi:hypothetical protein